MQEDAFAQVVKGIGVLAPPPANSVMKSIKAAQEP